MQLINEYNKVEGFFYVLLMFSANMPDLPQWQAKKGFETTNEFQKGLNESGLQPSKIWVDHASEFCNRLFKSWFHGKVFNRQGRKICFWWEIYQNLEEKDWNAYDRSIKNMHIDHVDEIVDKYNNTYHRTIKKPANVKSGT